MERTTTEEVMNKSDKLQSRFGKIDESSWWYLEKNSKDAGIPFTSMDLYEEC